MTESIFPLSKMEPMARKAMAELEAMELAIHHNNKDDVAKHLENVTGVIAQLKNDLGVHDKWDKIASDIQTDDVQLGAIQKYDNTDGNYSANDGAIALGVIRAGRTDKIFRPHTVI